MLTRRAHKAGLVVVGQQHTRAERCGHHIVCPHADGHHLAAIAQVVGIIACAFLQIAGIFVQSLQRRIACTDDFVGVDPRVVESPIGVRALVSATITEAEGILYEDDDIV